MLFGNEFVLLQIIVDMLVIYSLLAAFMIWLTEGFNGKKDRCASTYMKSQVLPHRKSMSHAEVK